jgi:hypothetical protein
MTQACEAALAVSTTPPARTSIRDRVVAEQSSELEAVPAVPPTELRAALVLAISSHDEAIDSRQLRERKFGRLRDLGVRWAVRRYPLDPLLSLLRGVTEKMARAVASERGDLAALACVRANGAAFAREVLAGFQHAYEHDFHQVGDDWALLASSLLWSDQLPAELRAIAADSYAVVAVHWPNQSAHEANTLLHNAFQSCGAQGTLTLVTGEDAYVLAPAEDERQALSLCRQVHDLVGGELRLAVSWRTRQEVRAGRQQACAVLQLARGREPGVYQLDDVLVEYAVMQEPSVLNCLISLITPVLPHRTLLTALDVLIDANGNRSKAAKVLNIHRSTLEHRLGRIEQLTGCQPINARGVQTLATALTAYRTVHRNPEQD